MNPVLTQRWHRRPAHAYRDAVKADAPLLYWRLGEGAGTAGANSVIDASGNGRHGTPTGVTFGAAGALAGDPDTAVSVATGDQSRRVERTGVTGLPVNTTDHWSIEFWHRTTAYVSLAQVFGFGATLPTSPGAKNGRYTLQFLNNYYFWGDSADWDTGIAWDADSTWHHIVWTWDGANLVFYRDGIPRASQVGLPSGMTTAANTVTLGSCNPSGSSPSCSVDEAAIYGTALSAARILYHYNRGAGR